MSQGLMRSDHSSGSRRSAETRARLLESGAEVFAIYGFRNARIQEICKRAKANIAAVNYHFGDKERLYMAVIEYAVDPTTARLSHLNLDPSIPAEERLSQFIRELLFSILGSGRPAWHGKLMAQETINPTAALDFMVEKVIRPLNDSLKAIVTEILGESAPMSFVEMCSRSIMSQCVTYHTARAIVERLNPDQTFDEAAIELLAEHITRFSLSALRAY